MKPNIIRGKIHHEEPVRIKIRKGISKSMNKVTGAVINGNNVQKMKVSNHAQGSVCVCVCVCFECPFSVVLGICITSITNMCVF
jgi:hypothetical protein